MQRSILVLALALSLTVALTVMIFEDAPTIEDTARIELTSSIPLSPYQYKAAFELEDDRDIYEVTELIEKAYSFWRDGDHLQAEDAFKTALLWEPQNPDVLKAIGQLVFLGERYVEATGYFVQYLDLQPDDVESYTNLAVSLLCSERVREAEEITKQGLERLGEKPGPFYFILACIHDRGGRPEAADEYLIMAYTELGDDLFKLVNAHWSASLKKRGAYALVVDRARTKQAAMATPAP